MISEHHSSFSSSSSHQTLTLKVVKNFSKNGIPQSATVMVTLPETNSSPLKMDGWNTILSYWGPTAYFQWRLLLVSGSP